MSTKVLFVDDDPLLLASLGRCLQGQYALKTFDSAVDALAFMEAEDKVIPVVITDMRMPVMDGAEFAIRAKKLSPSTQFLMLTGTPNDEQRVRRKYGEIVSGYMNKPCSPSQLSDAIDGALEAYEADAPKTEETVASA